MDSAETNSESNLLSSGGTDDTMNEAEDTDVTELVSRAPHSTVCTLVQF